MSGRHSRHKVSHERWLVSYADFITLLFAFFVVLYAFAKQDQKKQAEVSVAVDSAFQALGIFNTLARPEKGTIATPKKLDSPVAAIDPTGEEIRPLADVKVDLDQIQRKLKEALADQISRGTISIEMGQDGLVISLREAGFFDSGSATPRPDTVDTLRTVAQAIRRTPYNLRVEGHTDNVPVHNAAFDSNWELSSARATRIARMCLAIRAVRPERLSAAGYAEFHPIAANETSEGRAENRRVDLIVMPRASISLLKVHTGQPASNWRKITDD